MEISNVLSTPQLNTARNTQVSSQNQFSSDTFYKLLSAQLQYQDPMESMDNTQMILQMSQFATIEQLNNLNEQFGVFMEMSTVQDGAALVGKEVRIGLDDDTTIVGTVDKVGFSSAETLIQIDGKYYEMWRIIEIGEPTTPTVENGEESTKDKIELDETTQSGQGDTEIGEVQETQSTISNQPEDDEQ